MNDTKRVPVLEAFWPKTDEEPDTTLYEDELGWSTELKVESGGYTDTKDVWDSLMNDKHIRGVGWDLCIFYPPTGIFYYIDMIAKVLYKLPKNATWDGKAILYSVFIKPHIVPEDDELMYFDTPSEIWEHFTIDGKDMRYILEHSVLTLST